LLYVGTGTAWPWPRGLRSPSGGDNLFTSSIIGLRASTGEYVWHYQTTPGDEWGFGATSQLVAAELIVGGQLRSVLLQANRNGFLYVIDRLTGKLISADAYAPVTWAKSVDPSTGRPVEAAGARYSELKKPFLAKPGIGGAHDWQPMSFSPRTGLLYVPVQVNASMFSGSAAKPAGADRPPASPIEDDDSAARWRVSTQLLAWDPARRQARWRKSFDTPVIGGALATAGGLVFIGTGQGFFGAFDAETGELRWSADLKTSVIGPPISAMVGDEQMIFLAVGAGGGVHLSGGEAVRARVATENQPRLLAFSLTGRTKLPALLPVKLEPTGEMSERSTETSTASAPEVRPTATPSSPGARLYREHCARCHGEEATSAHPLPDLRNSSIVRDERQWRLIVHAGTLAEARGMPGFLSDLKPKEAESIRQYVSGLSKPETSAVADAPPGR
jgi:quinohemoprotein ethanol dehydrogenase